MVDRLRISGDAIITEDDSTGDVTVDIDALNTADIVTTERSVANTSGKYQDTTDQTISSGVVTKVEMDTVIFEDTAVVELTLRMTVWISRKGACIS